MSKPKKPRRSNRKQREISKAYTPTLDDSGSMWDDDLEEELNRILEKAQRADSNRSLHSKKSEVFSFPALDKSISLESEDLRVIDCLWQMTLETNYSERAFRLLNTVFNTHQEALQQMNRLNRLLKLGILVGHPKSGKGNRFMPFYWTVDEQQLLHTRVALSRETLACIQQQTSSFTPYFETGFQNSDEHLQAWIQLWETTWMLFNYRECYNSIETIWKPETDPIVIAMLQQLHIKEAKTKRKLKFKEYCIKYNLSDADDRTPENCTSIKWLFSNANAPSGQVNTCSLALKY